MRELSEEEGMERVLKGLIVAKPGRVRDGLQALLTAITEIDSVEQMDDTTSALRRITEQRPDLVLLDFSLTGDEPQAILKRIKAESPQTRCLALADDVEEQQIAKAAGADAILIKGFPAQRLIETVRRLLPPQASYG
jgi:DNA-binding NarL/FixJ family response regulator